jgi:hypothetical protein
MKTYNDMASLKPWTLFVVSVDQEGTVIHTGSKTFEIQPRHTEPVNLNLNSKYSMLKVNFYPIRDSVTKVELKLNGLVINDSVFAKQIFKGDTVKMSYNYMDTGTQHITLNAYGTMWGDENVLLYTADTTVSVLTGVDANYTVKLVWVGPTTPPAGQASMAVSLGSTGTTVINAYIDPPYRFYKFIINSVGFGAYNPCLITTHFMMGDTAYPKDISGATVISNSEVSCGTVENLLMGLGYLKPLGGVCPWEWVVDMHQAYLFTDFYIYCAEVGFYGAPTSITIYGGDSSEGPWNVIGEQTFTEAYNGATIPLHY